MKHIMRTLAYQLTRKRVSEKRISSLHISLKKQDISCFNLSTNPILSFDYNGARCYFRECPKLADHKRYFLRTIDDFFSTLDRLGIDRQHFKQDFPINLDFSDAAVSEFKAYLEDKTTDRHFLRTLYKADLISQKCRFSIWTEQTYDEAFFAGFGLGDRPEGTDDIGIYYIWCMRSAAIQYRTLKIARGKVYSYFNAVRAVASRIVAEAVGLEHMITNARFCTLHVEDGTDLFGLLSDSAPGTRMLDSDVGPSGPLQRELGKLFLLDLICNQADHGPNNYNVAVDASGAVTVCAFDNDNPMTFYPHFSLSRSLAGCSSFVDGKGRVRRPYLDARTVQDIEDLDLRALERELSPYLGALQLLALRARVEALRKAIRKAREKGDTLLLEAMAWGQETVERECSGAYGHTYLTKVVGKDA